MSTLGCPAGPNQAVSHPESSMPAPVPLRNQALSKPPTILKPTATCHWVCRRPQPGRSSEESRVGIPWPSSPALFPRSTGSQTATARPQNCLAMTSGTSLTPQGILQLLTWPLKLLESRNRPPSALWTSGFLTQLILEQRRVRGAWAHTPAVGLYILISASKTKE